MVFSPSLSFLLSRPRGGERLVVSGTGTAAASAPSLGLVLHSRHCRSENILLPQSLTLLSFSSLQRIFVSTKGKLFNIPWENARPGRGQRGALTSRLPLCAGKKLSPCHDLCPDRDPATFPPGEPLASKRPAPLPQRRRRRRVSDRVAHASPPPCRAALPRGCPCVLRLMGTRWAPSIPPSWLASRLLSGRGEAGWTPRTLQVPPCLQLSVGKQRFLCLFFGKAGGQGKITCLLGPRAVPLPHRLSSLSSVWRQRGKISPHGAAGAALASTAAAAAAHQLPPPLPTPSSSLPTLQSCRADAAS